MSRDWDNEYVEAESAEESLTIARAHSPEWLRKAASSGFPLLPNPVLPNHLYRKVVKVIASF